MSAASAAGPAPPRALVAASPVRSLVPVLALPGGPPADAAPGDGPGLRDLRRTRRCRCSVDQGPRSAFETVGMVLTFYPGVLMMLAGRCSRRGTTARVRRVLGPLPGRHEERVMARRWPPSLRRGRGSRPGDPARRLPRVGPLRRRTHGVPEVWHLLGAPVTIVGACLFGIMLGIWAPSGVTAVIGLVALVVADAGGQHRRPSGCSGRHGVGAVGRLPADWAGLVPGSPSMHVLTCSACAAWRPPRPGCGCRAGGRRPWCSARLSRHRGGCRIVQLP